MINPSYSIAEQFVDDVLIDAPFVITQEMLSSLKITTVIKGSCDNYQSASNLLEAAAEEEEGGEADMYELPRKLGILQTVQSSTHFSGEMVLFRY